MDNEQIAKLLQEHSIRATAVRIMIWRTLQAFDYAFALSDLEGILPTVDRSTIFRALTLFTDKELLHPLDDGSGQQKYCVCCEEEHECDGHHHHLHCEHVHITCTKCGHTYCLKNEQIPQVTVPEGFQIHHVQYVIQGICPRCARFRKG